MRLKRALAVCALIALSAPVTACGSDGGTGNGKPPIPGLDGDGTVAGGDGDGTASGGLPSAATIADVVAYLNTYGSCLDLEQADKYDTGELARRDPSWGSEPAEHPSWGIKERYVCRDNYSDTTTLLLVDMRKFQTSLKGSGYAGGSAGFLVGRDFVVIPGGRETRGDLKVSELKYLTCDPKQKVPSGYELQPALVGGCTLTDYLPTDN